MNNLPTLYQEFIYKSRYSRWIESENRRESWPETVGRYFDFFENHLSEKQGYKLPSDIRKELEEAVLNLEIMPSMRALMTAGEALSRRRSIISRIESRVAFSTRCVMMRTPPMTSALVRGMLADFP